MADVSSCSCRGISWRLLAILCLLSSRVLRCGAEANVAPIRTGQLVQLTPRHVTALCRNFTLGTNDYQSYSSDWQRMATPQTLSGKYPPGVDCTRVIQAPPNQAVKLQFMGYFEVEGTTDCLDDFLEVRDGPFGYSSSLGRFCGSKFPPDLISTQRFLWLRFHSDDMLEYRGLEIIVSFVTRSKVTSEQQTAEESQHCIHSLDALGLPSVAVTSNMLSTSYMEHLRGKNRNIDCILEVVTDERTRFSLLLESISGLADRRCEDGFVTIYDGSTATPKTDRMHYCANKSLTEPFLLTTNHLFIRVVARGDAIPSFRLSLAAGTASCDSYYSFDCINSICIPQQLVCNRQPDCPSKLDEVGCDAGELPAVSAVVGPEPDSQTDTSSPAGGNTHVVLAVVCVCVGIIAIGVCAQVFLMWCDRRHKKENLNRKQSQVKRTCDERADQVKPESVMLVKTNRPVNINPPLLVDTPMTESVRLSIADANATRSEISRSQQLNSFSRPPPNSWLTSRTRQAQSCTLIRPPTANRETAECGNPEMHRSRVLRFQQQPAHHVEFGSLRFVTPGASDAPRRLVLSRSVTMPPNASDEQADTTQLDAPYVDSVNVHSTLTPMAFYEV